MKQVVGGQATLAGSGGEPTGASREPADLDGPPRVFSRDTLGEW